MDKIQYKQIKQSNKNNQEFASEIHPSANLETNESENAFGHQNENHSQRPVSERTAWH